MVHNQGFSAGKRINMYFALIDKKIKIKHKTNKKKKKSKTKENLYKTRNKCNIKFLAAGQ